MTTEYESQTARIWQHLRQFGSITAREALLKIGCKRLSARVDQLRQKHGHERIKTIYGRGVNSVTGHRTRFAERYVYVTKEEIAAPKMDFNKEARK